MNLKRILSIVYFILLLTVLAFAQDKTGSVAITATSTTSAVFNVPDGYYLSGVNVPTMNSGTSALYLLTTIDGTTYDTLYYAGGRYEETVVETGCNVTFEFPAVYNWSKFKIAFDVSQTSNRTLKPNYKKK